MKLTFYGGAMQVTGSMFLLELSDGYKVLIDCGTDMAKSRFGEEQELFPFDPSSIDLVVLTHAHIDHSGKIPLLYKEGYNGQVLCTTPTAALSEILLHDASGLRKQQVRKKWNPKKKKLKEFVPQDTYFERDVETAMDRFVSIEFNREFPIKEGASITLIPAGHLLGAAFVVVKSIEDGKETSIGFSGDIGRKNYPLLPNPATLPPVDYLVSESTYGGRVHINEGVPEEVLEKIIVETCVDKAGRLIIPAFSVGRTQSLLYTLHRLATECKFPSIKVFADSPMAEQSTMVYQQHVSWLNESARDFNAKNSTLFDFDNLVYTSTNKESRAISDYRQPCIIIASSGMLTGGRMNTHVQKNINNPYCSIMFVGYCAEGTPGHQLRNNNSLKVNGREIPVAANVFHTDIFSGHGDRNDLMDFVKQQDASKLKKVFLVHGEAEGLFAFKNALVKEGYEQVVIPEKGQSFTLD
ncbi:MBL fold metallo-hydrolase [Cytophagaceae bacterium ABcell3]|nr:MBL fold metallo-hydrolase [Cytophagaceae bacterium ABcell3]